MNSATGRLAALTSEHPEWRPWLSLIERVLATAADQSWEQCVPRAPRRCDGAPLLADAAIVVPNDLLRKWLNQLIRAAAGAGTLALSTLEAAANSRLEAAQWFRSALVQDMAGLEALSRERGADIWALQSVAQLIPIPFLQACNRLWSVDDSEHWIQGYCPLCGAWPALAEVRGIERARYLRCGRCGKQWQAHGLRCVFCSNDDHDQLLSLVSESAGPLRTIEACKQCGGYLKSLATLHGGPPLNVLIDDLSSVDLDIAAIDQGFHRPQALGYKINLTLTAGDSGNQKKSLFKWSH